MPTREPIGNLDPEDFIAEIDNYGEVPSAWYHYVGTCPAAHNHPRRGHGYGPTCALCGGTGFIWKVKPIPDVSTGGKVLVSQAKAQKNQTPVQILKGDCFLVWDPLEYVGLDEGDRLLLGSREMQWREFIEHDPADADGDLLFHHPVTEIDAIWGVSGEITTGFSLSADGARVRWSSGPGERYTVLYRFRPSYQIVEGSVHHRRPGFPRTAIGRLWPQSPVDYAEGQD
jgi:hypothetical protein